MRTSRWVIGGAVLTLMGGGYWYFFMRTTATVTSNQVIRVTQGSITTSVKTTGTISPVQTSLLSFTRQGTITKINKKVGDTVKAGDVIAEIDARSAYMDIENARISLDNANNNYNKLFATTTEADRVRTKNSLEESKNSLNLLEAQYQDFLTSQKNTLAESEAQLTLLKEKATLAASDLDYTKKNLDTTSDATNLERDIANAWLSVEDADRLIPGNLITIRDAIYINNQTADRYGDLGSKNAYQKVQTEKLFSSVSGSLISFEKKLSTLRSQPTRSLDDVMNALTQARDLLTSVSNLASMAVEEYSNTPTGVPFSQSDIDTAQANLRTLGSTLSTKLSSLNNTYTTLRNYGTDAIQALANKNTITSKEQSLQSAQNDVTKAARALEALKTSQNTDMISRQNDIIRAKNTIALSEVTYDELVNGPTATDQKSAKNSIASAQNSLSKADLALRDYQIIATFEGVIGDIPWIIGDSTLSTEGILVENKNAYEISLSLDQIDIVKIHEGMKANITLDAFPTETYTGTVSRVSEVPTVTSGVVSYTAIVELTIPRSDIYSKMSTTVEIITTEKDNILTIPTSAITSEGGKSYVNRALDLSIFTKLISASRSGSGGENGRSFGSGSRGNFSGSGGFPPRDRIPTGSGEMIGSGMTGSGRNFSASGNTNSGMMLLGGQGGQRRGRGGNTPTLTTTETIPTEKIEITPGVSSDGKTEVISGLSLGDVIVILGKGSTKSTSSSTNSSSASTRRSSGFGGPPPGF